MSRLRTQLIVAFVVATLLPVAAAMWVASVLIDRSLGYSTIDDVDRVARMLEATARRSYQLQREALGRDVAAGLPPQEHHTTDDLTAWPDDVRVFWDSGEPERSLVTGEGGSRIRLMRRLRDGVDVHERGLGDLRMEALAEELRVIRERIADARGRDLRRGLTLTLVLLIAGVWFVSLVPVVLLASRVSRPIRELTAGLTDFAAGDWNRAVVVSGQGEVARAGEAFNHMSAQLRRNRDRLVYLAQMSSWQLLARKTAHEVKNSLTPIRLTVEEMVARQPAADPAFMARAARIVVSEIETLERRVRAFSDFAAEPPVRPEPVHLNALVHDRLVLLQTGRPDTSYDGRFDPADPVVVATIDLLKGILTNLLENAAEAAGPGGTVRVVTRQEAAGATIDVHDSGPGLDDEARRTLFEPTITFKKQGMGLGLLIARKNALLCGGDVALVPGELGGAGFRVWIPSGPSGASS
jgi:two-component system nitrogen regulation sensor histidine kinase NtrY